MSRSRRDVTRLSNKRSPYLFGVATANRTKVTTPNKYGAEIIARMSDWENQMSQENLFGKMILKLITYFTQQIYIGGPATDTCKVTLQVIVKKKVRDMDMNLVLWIWSTRTRTQTKVLVLVHFFNTRTRTHAKQSTRTRTRTRDLCTRPNPGAHIPRLQFRALRRPGQLWPLSRGRHPQCPFPY